MPCAAATRRSGRAYSFVELIGVLVVVSILSIAATPAVQWMTSARHRALEHEIARLLALARETSLATGRPVGVVVDIADQTAAPVWIPAGQTVAAPLPGATGGPTPPLVVAERFRGAAIISAEVDSADVDAVWFGFEGAPELRDASGAYVGIPADDFLIQTSGAGVITVRRISGLIE